MRINLLHVAAVALCGLAAHSAHASFHFMQIEQVIGGDVSRIKVYHFNKVYLEAL